MKVFDHGWKIPQLGTKGSLPFALNDLIDLIHDTRHLCPRSRIDGITQYHVVFHWADQLEMAVKFVSSLCLLEGIYGRYQELIIVIGSCRYRGIHKSKKSKQMITSTHNLPL